MKSHADALAILQPRQTRKARARRAEGVGSQPVYVDLDYSNASVTLPLRLSSTANTSQREHWTTKHRRAKAVRLAVKRALDGVLYHHRPKLPIVVLLTRIAPRAIKDAHDNLPMAFKHAVDEVAAWLGIDDSDPRVTWRYGQERGEKPRQYGVRIEWRAA